MNHVLTDSARYTWLFNLYEQMPMRISVFVPFEKPDPLSDLDRLALLYPFLATLHLPDTLQVTDETSD
ncbi:hypothetical protein ES703_56177 [subsurface metagenome]